MNTNRFNINKPVTITGSYLQESRHAKVTDKFNVIQPAQVGQAMNENGLQLVSLSTGRAKHEDKADFQRTLSRYRGPEINEGSFLDVIYDSKHMGRGVDKILLGIYRMVCTNGLFVGSNFFTYEIRHNGNTYDNLNLGIVAAMSQANRLASLISKMQSIQLDDSKKEAFALEAVKLLTPIDALKVKHRLLQPKRQVDTANDLWTVYNVIQENAMQGNNVGYTLAGTDQNGNATVRAMHSRKIKPNSGKDASFNGALFDIAEKFVA
jgi:hypothetical protein